VTVGNAQQPFDRLLDMVNRVLADHPEAIDGVCQIGPSRVEPKRLRVVRYLDRAEFDREIGEADVVVCHGGVGSLAIAIAHGHMPIALARRGVLGEHVNDHQLEVIAHLAATGRLLDATQGITRGMLAHARDARRSGTELLPDLDAIDRALSRAPAAPRRSLLPLRLLASLGPPLKRVR
jgi:UDP-N-acetylglucosamine transferase subunit ALG13